MKNKKSIVITLLIIGGVLGWKYFIDNDIMTFKNSNDSNVKEMNLNTKEHESEYLEIEGLNNPKGLVVVGDKLIVADCENNRIVYFNKSTKIVEKVVGKTGNKEREFLYPEGIAVDNDNNILVADSGNKRIQKFDLDGNFISSIEVDVLNNIKKDYTGLKDIEVDKDGNIYVSVTTFSKKEAAIYIIDKKQKIKKIGKGLRGYFAKLDGYVYFVSNMEYFEDEKSNGFQAGDNYVVKIENGKFKDAYYLPREYCPRGVVAESGKLYVVGGAANSIDEFTIEGNHIRTIDRDIITVDKMDKREEKIKEYITKDSDGNLYISDLEKDMIFFIKNK